MAKSTKKSPVPVEAPKPAVRRSRTTGTAAVPAEAPATRRAASPRRKKIVDVSDDRGLSAAVAAKASAVVSAPEPSHDEIATRAYFIHLRRSSAAGDQVNDWLQAVAELRGERGLI
jgi:hypothetical protein